MVRAAVGAVVAAPPEVTVGENPVVIPDDQNAKPITLDVEPGSLPPARGDLDRHGERYADVGEFCSVDYGPEPWQDSGSGQECLEWAGSQVQVPLSRQASPAHGDFSDYAALLHQGCDFGR
jgi:hypothetical protein